MHATDLLQYFYNTGNDTNVQALDYLINFVNNLDPNKGANPSGQLIYWPKYDTTDWTMLQFDDVSPNGLNLNDDLYRREAINALVQVRPLSPSTSVEVALRTIRTALVGVPDLSARWWCGVRRSKRGLMILPLHFEHAFFVSTTRRFSFLFFKATAYNVGARFLLLTPPSLAPKLPEHV